MKMRFKSTILTLALGLGITLGFAQLMGKKGSEDIEEVNKTAEYKAKTREKLKPHRYDGSKITFFNYLTYEQKKTLEVLMFNGIDYKFCFNTDGVPKGIDLKIYDKAAVFKDRVMMYEARGVMSKDIVVTSSDLLKALQEKKSGISSLKKIFIEYHVPVGDKVPAPAQAKEGEDEEQMSEPQEKGVVVVSYGYKNI